MFAPLAESSLVEDRTGWPIRKNARTVTGLAANGYLPRPKTPGRLPPAQRNPAGRHAVARARNLRTGEPVHIRLAGKRRSADVQVVTDQTGVVGHLASMARDNHQFARFNKIGLAAPNLTARR